MKVLPFFIAWAVLTSQAATGPIVIDPEYSHSFRYQSGERFFPMGDTAYFLIAQPTNVIARYIDVRRAHKFNFIRVMAMSDGFWPFGAGGGGPAKADYTRINETAMQKWDWVFDYAATRGMNIELILWGYGIGGGEGLWSREVDQDFWIKTLVQRFKDRENLFMLTIANEFERYPDGEYRFDAKDVEWARRVAGLIREIDSVHLIGCHPSVWITDQDPAGGARPFGRYKDFTQHRPPVVWPLWDGSAVNVNVTQNNEGVQTRTWGNFEGGHGLGYYSNTWEGVSYRVEWTVSGWRFEAAGLEDAVAADWANGKPVLNTEFGYQYEPGYERERSYTTRQVHHLDTVRKKAWKIATSGAFFAAGFESTAVRNFTLTDIENFRPDQLEVLYTFFTEKTEYWRLAPRFDLVASQNSLLALPGKEYVGFFPRGGTNYVKCAAGSYRVEWLHPKTGRFFEKGVISLSEGNQTFIPPGPSTDDWALHLKVQ